MLNKYKKYKNKLTKILKKSERLYCEERFAKARGNLKETWKVIKNTINPSSCNNLILHLILNCYMNIENHQISDKNIIAKK